MTIDEIANRLYKSKDAIKSIRKRITLKLHSNNIAEAIVKAADLRLV